MPHRNFLHAALPMLALGLFAAACVPGSGKPTVVIESPPHGSQFHAGDDVAVQSTSADLTGVASVELVVDGTSIRTDAVPGANGQLSFTCIQTWKATPGTHTLSVSARNTAGVAADPAIISISVLPSGTPIITQTPTPTLTRAPTISPTLTTTITTTPSITPLRTPGTPPPAACTNDAAFVADVSIPGGTSIAAGQLFNKTWRVRNTGTCTWGAGYQLVLILGAAMSTSTSIAVPVTPPGATVDLTVSMTAPADSGYHSSQWRLRSPAGVLFGDATTVLINVTVAPAQTVPAAPTNFAATGTGTTIAFTWLDNSINETGFRIYQVGVVAPVAAADAHAGTGGMAFNWTDQPCNVAASFYLRAYNSAGESASSATAAAVTVPCGADLSYESATPMGSLYISLTDNSSNEAGFHIYRSDTSALVSTQAARTGVGFKGATAIGPFPCGSHIPLYARAFNSAGESAPSATIDSVMLKCQVSVTFTGVDILSVALSKPGVAHVRLKFTVNGQVQYWPSATDYQAVNVGDARTFSIASSILLMRDTDLNLKVEGSESEYNSSIQQTVQSNLGTVEKTYSGANDWGKGAHVDESARVDGSYRIHYTINVTP